LPVKAGLGAIASDAKDILSGDCWPLFTLLEDVSRKGFRETGRGGSSGDGWLEREFGEAARFRNGLFEDKLRDSPGDVPESI